jgi:hypothetical protein
LTVTTAGVYGGAIINLAILYAERAIETRAKAALMGQRQRSENHAASCGRVGRDGPTLSRYRDLTLGFMW